MSEREMLMTFILRSSNTILVFTSFICSARILFHPLNFQKHVQIHYLHSRMGAAFKRKHDVVFESKPTHSNVSQIKSEPCIYDSFSFLFFVLLQPSIIHHIKALM